MNVSWSQKKNWLSSFLMLGPRSVSYGLAKNGEVNTTALILTSTDKSASQTEQRVSQVLHRLRKTPAVEHVHASKDTHRRPEQPRVPNEGALHDHSGDFLACVIDHQRSSFKGCYGVPCRETKCHESDEELD